MSDVCDHVVAVRVEVSLQRELVTADKVPAVAPALYRQSGQGFFLYADVGCAPVILKDLLQIAGTIAAARLDSVKALRVLAWIVINLELVVAADFELVADFADLNRVKNISFGF